MTATIFEDALGNDLEFSYELTRFTFEQLCKEIFERMREPLDKAINDSGLTKDDIEDIVLIGGSTRIPKVQTFLENYFNGRKLGKHGNPDEDVARGAAILGKMIASGERLKFNDITSLAYGVEVLDRNGKEVIDAILPRNTLFGNSRTIEYKTIVENQTRLRINVLQGKEHRDAAAQCISLGKFEVKNLPPGPAGSVRVNVTFTIDEDGKLQMKAEQGGRIVEEQTIQNQANFSAAEIESLVAKQAELK